MSKLELEKKDVAELVSEFRNSEKKLKELHVLTGELLGTLLTVVAVMQDGNMQNVIDQLKQQNDLNKDVMAQRDAESAAFLKAILNDLTLKL